MQHTFFILLLSSAFCANSKLLDQGEVELKKCNPSIVQLFVSYKLNTDQTLAELPDAKTKKICPTLDQTCCPSDMLEAQFDLFLQTLNFYTEIFANHSEILDILKHATIVPTKTDESQNSSQSGSYKMSEAMLLSEFYGFFQRAYDDNKQLPNIFANYYSGFMCNYCHPDTFNNFVRVTEGEGLENFYFYFDSKTTVPLLIKLQYVLLNYVMDLAKSFELINALYRQTNDKDIIKFNSYQEFSEDKSLIEECQKQKKDPSDAANNYYSQCFAFLDKQHIFLSIGDSNIQGIKNILDRLKEYLKYKLSSKNEEKSQENSQIEKTIEISDKKSKSLDHSESKLVFFSLPEDDNWFSLSNGFSDDGFRMDLHKYDENLWMISEVSESKINEKKKKNPIFKSAAVMSGMVSMCISLFMI